MNKKNPSTKDNEEIFSRTEKLIGKESVQSLHSAKVAVFGLGGVGSFVLESLVRSGIENFVIVDNDTICKSNINRQLFALHSTVGILKTDCAISRSKDINPKVSIDSFPLFYGKETAHVLDASLQNCDYIVDAIDNVSAKILLAEKATQFKIPLISSMGTGNKLDPTRFEITNIHRTSVCPLARVMRRELKKRGIQNIKVLYSKEEPKKEHPPASISFVPSVAGLIIASEVVKDILNR